MNQNINIYNIVAANIKKYRKEAGITQKQLAELSGYSHEYIRYIEAPNSYKSFSVEFVFIVSNVLNIEIYKLFLY